MEELVFAQASPDDLDNIMDLETTGFPPGIVEDRRVFARRLEVFPQGFFLLRVGSKPAGYLTAEIWEPRTSIKSYPYDLDHDISSFHRSQGSVLYVASMTVHPQFRGLGYGEKLFQTALESLRKDFPKIERILLIVGESWLGAQRIYQRSGFVRLGFIKDFLHPQGAATQGVWIMGRNLV